MTDSIRAGVSASVIATMLSLSPYTVANTDFIFDPIECEANHAEYSSGPGYLMADNPMYDLVNSTEQTINNAILDMNNGEYTLQQLLSQLTWGVLSTLPIVEAPRDPAQNNAINDDHYYIDDIVFTNPVDGIQLPANISYPRKSTVPEGGFPVVIVPPGWAGSEYSASMSFDYRTDYVVVRYTPRGFATLRNGVTGADGFSYRTGQVDMVGCKDMSDIETIIDTIGQYEFQQELAAKIDKLHASDSSSISIEPDINSEQVGMAGISYGSLLSLRALSQLEDKIKVAAALDGGISFLTTFFEGNTTHWPQLTGLYAAGVAKGNAPAYMTRLYRAFISAPFDPFYQSPEFEDWNFVEQTATSHSPGTYLDQLNAANKPVYIGALWDDQMFKPGQHFDYFSRLTVDHKRMGVANGSHGDVTDLLLSGAKQFIDYHLLGQTYNGAKDFQMSMTVANAYVNGEQAVDNFETWPNATVQNERLYLKNKSLFDELPLAGNFGSLQDEAYKPVIPRTDYFTTKEGPNAINEFLGPSTGLPNMLRGVIDLSDIINGGCHLPSFTGLLGNRIDLCQIAENTADKLDERFGLGEAQVADRNLYLTAALPLVKNSSIIWSTPSANTKVELRGCPSLELYAKSDKANSTYVAYLYDLNPKDGEAKFVTHGVYTVDGSANRYQKVKIDLQPIAWDLPPGHQFALAIDGHDPQYIRRQKELHQVTVKYNRNQLSYIDLPIKTTDGNDIWNAKEHRYLTQLAAAKVAAEEAAIKAAAEAKAKAEAAKRAAAKAAAEARARAEAAAKKAAEEAARKAAEIKAAAEAAAKKAREDAARRAAQAKAAAEAAAKAAANAARKLCGRWCR